MSTTSLDLTSFEADARQLSLAREQGAAYRRALEHMVQTADRGAMQPAAEYLIGYALRPAEGSHDPVDGALAWSEPGDDELLLAVAVCDSSDGRFVPGVRVTATFVDGAGEDVATHELGVCWDPLLYHYAANVARPADGDYALRVSVAPPAFARHDRLHGDRFAHIVTTTFRDVGVRRSAA
jgi:hypothetical protein